MLEPSAQGSLISGQGDSNLLEKWQDAIPAPFRSACLSLGSEECSPTVVVLGRATHVNHGVYRRTTSDLSGNEDLAILAIEIGLRYGLETRPVRGRGIPRSGREVDIKVKVHVTEDTGFKDQDVDVRVLGEAVRHSQTCSSTSDDDIVITTQQLR